MTTVMYWVGVMLLSMLAVAAVAAWAWLFFEIARDYQQPKSPPPDKTQYKPSATFKLRSPKSESTNVPASLDTPTRRMRSAVTSTGGSGST
jgi:hypothetical protein